MSGRSLNAEIVYRLERSFDKADLSSEQAQLDLAVFLSLQRAEQDRARRLHDERAKAKSAAERARIDSELSDAMDAISLAQDNIRHRRKILGIDR